MTRHRIEAAEIMRTLIDRIELTPITEGRRKTLAGGGGRQCADRLEVGQEYVRLTGARGRRRPTLRRPPSATRPA
jgi:hypothetical protein